MEVIPLCDLKVDDYKNIPGILKSDTLQFM